LAVTYHTQSVHWNQLSKKAKPRANGNNPNVIKRVKLQPHISCIATFECYMEIEMLLNSISFA